MSIVNFWRLKKSNSNNQTSRAIISKYIRYNIIVHKNGAIYELKDNVVYESWLWSGNIDEDILVNVSTKCVLVYRYLLSKIIHK